MVSSSLHLEPLTSEDTATATVHSVAFLWRIARAMEATKAKQSDKNKEDARLLGLNNEWLIDSRYLDDLNLPLKPDYLV